jgi:signal transduction histidine kinase
MESSSHHFFSFFDPLVADELRKGVTISTVVAQEIIFDEEDQSDCLYLVLSGKVELCKRAGERTYLTIAFAGENDFFGELGVLDGSVRSTRAVAVEETTLARVDRKPILAALRNTSGKTVIDLFNRTIQHLRLTDERYVAAIVRKEKVTLLWEMAGSIIHDLRNPCHGVMMASMLIQKLHSDNKTERCCDIIQNQVNHMVSTLDELLEFSRGTYQLNRETVSMAVLMEKFAALNRDYLKQNNIELELPPAEVSIHADCSKLLRVLQCLVFKAVDAMKENNGKVTISGQRLDGAVEICVRDNGPGISDAVKDLLFEPFVTADRNSGGGLGLAICKSIVEAHGGRIFCESNQGQGTAFFVQLPVP